MDKKTDAELLAGARALDAQYASADAFDAKHANDGRTPSRIVYRLVIDNGVDYGGELPGDFATEDEAETDKQSETHRRVRTVTIY